MPVLNFELTHDGRPIVELYLVAGSIETAACLDEDRSPPQTGLIRALVDTGTGRSHVDLATLERLAIPRTGSGWVYTASGGPAESSGTDIVNLTFAGDRPGPLALDLEDFGSPIAETL